MPADQKTAPPTRRNEEEIRARNVRALQLIREWRADKSDYDLKVFPVLQAEMEADRSIVRPAGPAPITTAARPWQ